MAGKMTTQSLATISEECWFVKIFNKANTPPARPLDGVSVILKVKRCSDLGRHSERHDSASLN